MSHPGLDFSQPAPRQKPLEVAADTFLIRGITPSVGGSWTNLNSMLICAAEPIIVDTGMVIHREQWFEDVFSLLAPDAVRWIFVTHNDSDHSGNLVEALERCPNARVISSNGESYRTWASFGIPMERIRKVDDGERFSLGDRWLHAVRPPVYDSPYTRGVLDERTGVYYASDAFCAPMPEAPVDWVAEIPPALWAEGMASFHHTSLCPWVALVDQQRFTAEVERLAALEIRTLLGAHTPAIGGADVAQALRQMVDLPRARF